MTIPNGWTMEPEARMMLGRHREELLRRALALAVRRSSLEELSERPLGERLAELELVFEAAAVDGGAAAPASGGAGLQAELQHQLDEYRRHGRVFSVAVAAAGHARVARLGPATADRRPEGPDARAWSNALRECAAPHDVVIDAGDGSTAIVLPDHDAREARVAADRLCQSAWRILGGEGPPATAGIATYPTDGSSATELLAAAYDSLWRLGDVNATAEHEAAEDDAPSDEGPPAPVHPLRPL